MSKAGTIRALSQQALKTHGCLNSMEVCRAINGFDIKEAKACYPQRHMSIFNFGGTHPQRCTAGLRGCAFWSLEVYKQLRRLWRQGKVQSVKMRFWDGGRQKSINLTDLFRFWFLDKEAFESMVTSQLAKAIESGCALKTIKTVFASMEEAD